ncbi:hypothetical protein A2U01_0004120 [Trifolium medium]|uniref:Uncharacterized protein n=1 Tax=Trifolium medium TaxID=97028 RepID=A0A392M7K4_9FABA|nr:hypothetical protein [Trifolium medium]
MEIGSSYIDSPSYDSSDHDVPDFDGAVGGNSNVEHKFVIPHYFRPRCGLGMPNFGILAEEGGGEIATYHVALPGEVFVCHWKCFVSDGIRKCGSSGTNRVTGLSIRRE